MRKGTIPFPIFTDGGHGVVSLASESEHRLQKVHADWTLLPVAGLYGASISLAFAPKIRYVRTVKIIYGHSVQVT